MRYYEELRGIVENRVGVPAMYHFEVRQTLECIGFDYVSDRIKSMENAQILLRPLQINLIQFGLNSIKMMYRKPQVWGYIVEQRQIGSPTLEYDSLEGYLRKIKRQDTFLKHQRPTGRKMYK